MPENDSRLLHRARNGDRNAFGTLVKKYQQKVLYLAYDLVNDYDTARDVAQDTFIRAYTKLDQFEDRAMFSTWLYRITVNMALDACRRKKRNTHQSLEDSLPEIEKNYYENEEMNTTPGQIVENKEMYALLRKALENLTENQKTATVLKYFHQKTSGEIAEIMGCAESTVRIHIHRALGNLRKKIALDVF